MVMNAKGKNETGKRAGLGLGWAGFSAFTNLVGGLPARTSEQSLAGGGQA